MPLLKKTGLEKIKTFTACLKNLKKKIDTIGFGPAYYTFVAEPVAPEEAISDERLCRLHDVNNQILFQTSFGMGLIEKEKLQAGHWAAILAAIQQAADSKSEINLSSELRQALVKAGSLSLHVALSLGVYAATEASEHSQKTLETLIKLLEELIDNNDANYWDNEEKGKEVFLLLKNFTGGIGHYVPACFDLLSYEMAKLYDDFLCSIDLKTDVVTTLLQKTVISNLNPKFIQYLSDNTKQHIRLFEMAMIEFRRKIVGNHPSAFSLNFYKKTQEIESIIEATKRLLTFVQIRQADTFTSNSNLEFLIEIRTHVDTKEIEFVFEEASRQEDRRRYKNRVLQENWPEICAALVDERVKDEDKDFLIELVKQEYAKLYVVETVEPWSLFSLTVDGIMQHYAEKLDVLMTEFLNDHSTPEKTIFTLDTIINTTPAACYYDSLSVYTGTKEFMVAGFLVEEKNLLEQARQLGNTSFQEVILTKVKENFVSSKEEYSSLMKELSTTIETIQKDLSDYGKKRQPSRFKLFQPPEKHKIAENIITSIKDALEKTETENMAGGFHPTCFHNYLNALLCMFLSASVKHAQLLRKKESISHGELGEIITKSLTKIYDLLDKISLRYNPSVFYTYLSSSERNTIDIPTLDLYVSNSYVNKI